LNFTNNKFKVGATPRGTIAILGEVPERLTPEDAANLAAWLLALSLGGVGKDPPPCNIHEFLEGVSELVEGSLLAEQIKAELG
jgi:hypothetical protein